MVVLSQNLISNISIGQVYPNVTMTAPTSVCALQDFSINIHSDARIYFQLDFTTNNGITWTSTGLTFSTTGTGTNFNKTYVGLNINQTTRYRIRYTTDAFFTNPTPIIYEPVGGLTVTLYPTPIIANFSNTSTCGGTAFSVTPVSGNGNDVPTGTTYTWTVSSNPKITGSSDQNIGQTNISQLLTNTTSAIQTLTYTVVPTSNNGCIGDPFNVPVSVNPTPQIGTVTSTAICSDQTLSFTPVDGTDGIVPAGTTYTWTVDANPYIIGETDISAPQSFIGLNQTLKNITTVQQTVVYHVTPVSSLNCTGTTFTLNVPVNPIPYINNKSYSICSNNAFLFAPEVGDKIPSGTTYSWTVASNTNVIGQSDQNTQSTISQTFINNSTSIQTVVYTVIPRTADGCDGPSFTITITITPTPIISNKTQTVCSGGSFSVQPQNGVGADIVPPGTAYTWTVAPNANVTGQSNQNTGQLVIAQTLVNQSNTDQHILYTVTSTTANGCNPTTFQIDVTVVPTAVISDKNATICSNHTFSVTPTNGGGDIVLAGTQYTWTVVDNPNITGDVDESLPQLSISQNLINTSIVPQTVVYTVTSNSINGCASTTFTVTVLVKPSPAIGSISPAPICSGLSFSVLPINGVNGDRVPANTTYVWTVSVNNNVTGQSNDNSGQSSISQTLTNIDASVQTLTYTVTPTSTGCTGSNFTITVVVNPRPSISDKTPNDICSGSIFNVTPITGSGELVPIGTTYAWTVVPNSNISGQSNLNAQSSISQLLINLTNINQILTYSVTPISALGCSGPIFNLSVTVKPVSSIANQNLTICSETAFDGTPTNLTNIIPLSTTYTWTVTNNSNITGASNVTTYQGNIGQTLTNISSATQSLTYTVQPNLLNGCTANPFNIIVNVNPKPAIANIVSISAPSICSGSSFNISPTDGTDIVPLGTQYTWTVSNNTFISGQSNVNLPQTSVRQILNNLSNVNRSLVYSITPSTQAGCTGTLFQVTVTVKPTATIQYKTQTICSESSFLITPTNDGTDIIPANTTYTWVPQFNSGITGANTQNSGQVNITQTLTNLTSGIQTQTYSITPVLQNACAAASFTLDIIVKPKPKIANFSVSVCSTNSFNANPVDGLGTDLVPSNTLYTWIVGSNGNLLGQSNQSIPQTNISQQLSNSTSITQTIYYTVFPTAAACAGPQFTLQVDVKATPNITAYTPVICSGSSFTVLPTNVGNIVPAGTRFTWNVLTNGNVAGYANQVTGQDRISQLLNNLTNTNQIVNYTVTATTLQSCASTFSITVTVKPTSSIANKTATICTGNNFNVTPVNGTDIVPSGTTYTWTVTPNVNITGAINQNTALSTVRQTLVNIANSVQNVNYTVNSILNNGCTGATFNANITVNPLPTVTVNATSISICDGDAVSLSGAGALSYSWDNNVLNGVAFVPTTTLVYTVTGTDQNGCVNTASQTIVVNPHPIVSVPLNTVDRCGTGSMVFTAYSNFGEVKWYDLATGGVLMGSGNNLNIASISSNTAYYADALSSAGCYALIRKQVNAVIKDIPTIVSVENNFNCGPGSISLKASPSAGVVNWYSNNSGGASLSTSNTYVTPSISKTTTYFVDATFNNCTSLNRVAVVATVDTIPVIAITNPQPVCYPLTQDITNTYNIVLANSSLTYSYWKDINATQPLINPAAIASNGIYYVKASDAYQCFDIKPVNVLINTLPPSPIVSPVTYCQNDLATGLTAQPLLAHSLKWYSTNSSGGTGSALATIPTTSIVGNQNYYVSQVNDTSSCESPRASIVVTTLALPVISISSSSNPICYADSLILSASGALSYSWDKGVINNQKFKIYSSDRYTVIGTDRNGCKATSYIDQVVNPLPIANTPKDLITVCIGANFSLVGNVKIGSAPYQFFIYSDSASVVANNAGILFAKKGGIATVYYKVIDAFGCVSENSTPFKVKVDEPIKSQIIYQEAFYDLNTIIKTKTDLGYTVYDWGPQSNLSFYNDKDPVFRGINDFTYTLFRLNPTSYCSVTDTYNITITTNFIFDLPNVFTPNSDLLNDKIKAIYNGGIASLNYLKIYNRKGNIVFQSNQLNEGWDGKVNGIDQEPDAFYWIAEYVTRKNETFRKSGSFLLIK